MVLWLFKKSKFSIIFQMLHTRRNRIQTHLHGKRSSDYLKTEVEALILSLNGRQQGYCSSSSTTATRVLFIVFNNNDFSGSSNVRPFLGIPRFLSSNKFVGAFGRPDLIFPDIVSFSLKAPNILLPIFVFF